jgi:Holliday junction resolvasome RuvABC DNA-binding subunit
MGIGIENPGVMRRMKVNKNIDELKDIQNQGTGPTHFHPTDEMTGEAKISMFYSVISRLRELGYKEADIFKYIKMISKKKKASGESDWMLYNSGGKV